MPMDHTRCSQPRKHATSSTAQDRRSGRPLEGIQRHALTEAESAASLGMSVDTFRRYVKPEIRCVRIGRGVRLRHYFAPDELRKFVERQSSLGL